MIDIDQLYKQYYPQIYGYALKIVGVQEDAEEIAQDIFIKVWEHPGLYDESRPFPNWALTVTKNSCIDFLRGKQKEYSIFDNEVDLDTAIPVYSEGYSFPELYGKYRMVYTLKNACGLRSIEISEICGISRANVFLIIRMIKQDVKKALLSTAESY